MQGLVDPPNIGISVPSNICMSSKVHTTLRVNLWLVVESGRPSSSVGSGNVGPLCQKVQKHIYI